MRTAPRELGSVLLKDLEIDFLSPVPKPAHRGAVAVLMKRDGTDDEVKIPKAERAVDDDSAEPVTKRRAFKYYDADGDTPVVMTSNVDGHAHLIGVRGRAGETTWQTSEDAESGHSHPWILAFDGDGSMTLVIGESEGHSHEIENAALTAAFAAAMAKGAEPPDPEDDPMPKPKTDDVTAEDSLALARLILPMGDDERGYFETLDAPGKASFVQKSADDRKPLVKAWVEKKAAEAIDADPVVHTGRDGTVYRKSADPAVVALAKSNDELAARLEKAEDDAVRARLEKRAGTELGSLPGTVDAKVELLKALDKIPDEAVRKQALAAVRAGNLALAKGLTELGSSDLEDLGLEGDGQEGAGQSELTKLVAEYQKGHPEASEAQAHAAVLKTSAGRAAWKKMREEDGISVQ